MLFATDWTVVVFWARTQELEMHICSLSITTRKDELFQEFLLRCSGTTLQFLFKAEPSLVNWIFDNCLGLLRVYSHKLPDQL